MENDHKTSPLVKFSLIILAVVIFILLSGGFIQNPREYLYGFIAFVVLVIISIFLHIRRKISQQGISRYPNSLLTKISLLKALLIVYYAPLSFGALFLGFMSESWGYLLVAFLPPLIALVFSFRLNIDHKKSFGVVALLSILICIEGILLYRSDSNIGYYFLIAFGFTPLFLAFCTYYLQRKLT